MHVCFVPMNGLNLVISFDLIQNKSPHCGVIYFALVHHHDLTW
jgi:hypothetical protein